MCLKGTELSQEIEAVSLESNAVFESHFDIVDLWTQEAIEADKLIIILKSSCHFSNISENVHPESTIPKWESKTALDSIETASTYSPVAPLVRKVH